MPAYIIHLREKRRITENLYVLGFDRPPDFSFVPGQYLRFHHEEGARDYTLINAPADADLKICLRHLPKGLFTPHLVHAMPGQPFSVEGPLGYFRFQSDPANAVFVATGTGVAPFVAFARAGVRGFTLLHGASTPAALLYEDELRAAAGRYRACLSATQTSATARLAPWLTRGHVTDLLRTLPPIVADFYLCGNMAMIGDAIEIIDARFEGSRIFTETFY